MNRNWLELKVTGEAKRFLDANNLHIIVLGFDLVFSGHRSILVSNRRNGSIFFDRSELSRGFEMLAFSQERVDLSLKGLDLLGAGESCEEEAQCD